MLRYPFIAIRLGRGLSPPSCRACSAHAPDRSRCDRWLNAIEGFFAKLTRRRLQRGVFHSLVDPQAAINRYLAEHNQAPRPFVWTAEPDAILAKVKRGYQMLDTIY